MNNIEKKAILHLNDLKENKYKDNTGWLRINQDVAKIKKTASKIKEQSEVLVVIGIGGSYLGAKAVIEALTNKYEKSTEIIYLGNSISSYDLQEAVSYLKGKDFSVNVISKSGTTLEPALAFSIIEDLLLEKYGEENAYERMYITTDYKNGFLRKYINDKKNKGFNIENFIVPEDVGGRYSVLTPVGLLPICVAGVNIDNLLMGAKKAEQELFSNNHDGDFVNYAVERYKQYKRGMNIEILTVNEPRLQSFTEWWKQLFGESEGKDGKGLFPVSAVFSTDLHSLGQMIQDGKKTFFETHLIVESNPNSLIFHSKEKHLELANNMKIDEINLISSLGTIKAHTEGFVQSYNMRMISINEESIGNYIYFFMVSCAVSSLLLGVNPFNQPGVENYKTSVKELLKQKSFK